MSLKDAEMQVVSLAGAGLLAGALIVPVVWFTEAAAVDTGPKLDDLEVIEATIAYRKTPKKQPQKKTAPPPVEKPEGVSRDENKKPVEDKKDKKPATPDDKNPFGDFARPDMDSGPATKPEIGDFNGSDKGFAPESKGDPFFGRLRADMNFQFPEIARANSIPVGCIHMQADGRIKGVTFDPPIGQKGDDDLQTAAEAALNELKKTRAQSPEPVPTHLLSITSKWLCFKFSVSSG